MNHPRKQGGGYGRLFWRHLETCAFPNLEFNIKQYLGPGEIELLKHEGMEQKKPPEDRRTALNELVGDLSEYALAASKK